MYLVAIAWLYVVLLMTLAEATSTHGTVLGAVFTLLLYGALPLAIVMYVIRTPARRRARRASEQSARQAEAKSALEPDGGDHAASQAVAPEGKEP